VTPPAFHSTWTRLQGLDRKRPWLRFGEILAAVQAEGLEVTVPEARRELAKLPRPPKRYGFLQYTPQHLAAVRAIAKAAAKKETT